MARFLVAIDNVGDKREITQERFDRTRRAPVHEESNRGAFQPPLDLFFDLIDAFFRPTDNFAVRMLQRPPQRGKGRRTKRDQAARRLFPLFEAVAAELPDELTDIRWIEACRRSFPEELHKASSISADSGLSEKLNIARAFGSRRRPLPALVVTFSRFQSKADE
jgi:hypothetical protein